MGKHVFENKVRNYSMFNDGGSFLEGPIQLPVICQF
jgi:hypothetical protein